MPALANSIFNLVRSLNPKPSGHNLKHFLCLSEARTTTDLSGNSTFSNEMNHKIDKVLSNVMVKNYNNACH